MSWAAQQLAEFAASVSAATDEHGALLGAVERGAEALDADFGAIVRDGAVPASIGFAAGAVPGAALSAACAPGAPRECEIPGLAGRTDVLVAPMDPGWLVVGRAAEQPFAEDERALVRGMARVLSLALRTIGVVTELTERQALFERLSKIQQSITRRADLQETLDAIVEGAADLMQEPLSALRLVDADDPTVMRIVASAGFEEEVLETARVGRVGDGAGGRAISEERLVVIEDYAVADEAIPVFVERRLKAAIAAPVREQGRVVGSLVVASDRTGRHFSPAEQELLLAFAEHASLALTDARMVADAMHRAVHDALTGLPNRVLFGDRVAHALMGARRHRTKVAILFIDLDNFKVVNDSLGHQAGDDLLIAVAGRLRRTLRASDTIARFGGDEFAVLVEDVRTEQDAVRVAEEIAGLFVHPFPLAGRDHFVTASIGIAISDRTASEPDALVRNADAAMYRAKAHGRAGYELFDEAMRARATYRLRIESELHRALDRDELALDYQPIVALHDGSILGAEALVRWDHPDRGRLGPGEFIPIAEESGLIVPVGEWVLRAACREAAAWAALRPDGPLLQVSVNVSARHLGDQRLPAQVARALQDGALDPALLLIEITESALLEDAERPNENLRQLREMGIGLVLDDFGTGYSSLGLLKRLRPAGLKIDRSFVGGLGQDPDDSAIVSAVAGMARGLGISVTAEGVESDDQAGELRHLAVQRAQGYYFGRPMAAERFRALAGSPLPR